MLNLLYSIIISSPISIIKFHCLIQISFPSSNSQSQCLLTYLALSIRPTTRPVASEGWGGGLRAPIQFLAEKLTLSQPGGHIMPNTLLRAPSDFQTLRRHCILYRTYTRHCPFRGVFSTAIAPTIFDILAL